jgi:hypothetical protein
LGLSGGAGLPLGLPPGPEDPAVAAAAPEECLFYLSWAGTAKPDPKSANQLEQLIAEPEIQQFVAEVERRIRDGLRAAAAREDPQAAAMVDDLVELVKKVLTSPGAIYVGKLDVGREPPPRIQAGAVFNLGEDAAKTRTLLEKHRKLLGEDDVKTVQIGGETFYRIKPDPDAPTCTWGVYGKHFVVGIGESEAEAIVKRMSGSPPAWLAQIRRQLTVERPSTVTYVNVKKIVATIEASFRESSDWQLLIRVLGLNNFTYLASVSGLDETGFVSKTLLAMEKPDGDVLSFLGRKPLEAKDLGPIPKDATLALAARFDAARFWEMLFGLAKDLPQVGDSVALQLGETEKKLGFRIREDLLQSLGDVWCIYNSPGEGGLVITGLTAVVPLKDPDRAAAAHAKLLAFWNISAAMKAARFSAVEAAGKKVPPRFREQGPPVQHVRFADKTIFTLSGADRRFPFAPSWCLTDKELIVALFPQNVKAYLSRGADFQSLAAAPEVAELLKSEGGPVIVGYQDTPELFRLIYPIVQIAAKFMLGELRREGIDVDLSILPSAASINKHLRPAVKAVRRTKDGIEVTVKQSLPGSGAGALLPLAVNLVPWYWGDPVRVGPPPTARVRSMNILKQIGLAMHIHHDALKTLPPAYSVDKNGKPLLSWRVLILPYIEQEPLYRQFHLDEPWDSEHNKKLIPLMPEVYRAPGSKAAPGKTNYLTVRGKDTMFPGDKGISFAQVKDGTSYTIMVVEASDSSAVEWTRPDDFVYDPKEPIKGLVGLRPEGFLALFGDASVRFIPKSIDAKVLQFLFLRNDQNPVPDDFDSPSPQRARPGRGGKKSAPPPESKAVESPAPPPPEAAPR